MLGYKVEAPWSFETHSSIPLTGILIGKTTRWLTVTEYMPQNISTLQNPQVYTEKQTTPGPHNLSFLRLHISSVLGFLCLVSQAQQIHNQIKEEHSMTVSDIVDSLQDNAAYTYVVTGEVSCDWVQPYDTLPVPSVYAGSLPICNFVACIGYLEKSFR